MTGRVAAAADGPHGLLEAAQGWVVFLRVVRVPLGPDTFLPG